jgi:hypothetical protein
MIILYHKITAKVVSISFVWPEKWANWMLEGDGIVDGAAKEPLQKFVAELLVDVYTRIRGQSVRNSWTKTGLKWF